MPCIGCGLDKLSWPKVKKIIYEVFQGNSLEIKIMTNAPSYVAGTNASVNALHEASVSQQHETEDVKNIPSQDFGLDSNFAYASHKASNGKSSVPNQHKANADKDEQLNKKAKTSSGVSSDTSEHKARSSKVEEPNTCQKAPACEATSHHSPHKVVAWENDMRGHVKQT